MILLLTILIAYLYGCGAAELLKDVQYRNPVAFLLGITIAAPYVVWYGVLSIRWKIKRWLAIRRGKRAARRVLKKIGENHADNKELLEDIKKLLKK
jgi:hypothetical protein